MADFNLKAIFSADISKFKSAVNEVLSDTETLEGMTKLNAAGMSSAFKGIGAGLTAGFTAPIVAASVAGVKSFGDFDGSLRETMAAMGRFTDETGNFTGAAAEEYRKLSDTAKEWGQDSIFSSTEVAGAMEILASRGMDVNGIMASGKGVVDLAAASQMELSDSANAVGSALQQFSQQGLTSTKVADVFAQAAADTALQGTDLADAMRYAGTAAGMYGMSYEETAAALGVMADNGLKAEQSGRYLGMAFTKMANPTDKAKKLMEELGISFFNSEGKMKPLAENVAMLQDKFSGLTDEQRGAALATIFGQEAARGMNALILDQDNKLATLTTSFMNSEGAAKNMADTINSGTKGAFEQMTEAVNNAVLTVGEVLAPVFIQGANMIKGFFDAFNNLPSGVQTFIVVIAGLVAAIGPLLFIFGAFIGQVQNLSLVMPLVTGAIKGAGTAFGFLTGPIGIVIGIVAALAAGLVYLWKTNEGFRTAVIGIWNGIKGGISTAISGIQEFFTGFKAKVDELKTAIPNALGNMATAAQNKISEFKTAAISRITEFATGAKSKFDDFKSKATNTFESFKSSATSKIKEFGSNAISNISTFVGNAQSKYNDFKSKAGVIFDAVKREGGNKIQEMGSTVVTNLQTMVNNAGPKLTGFVNSVRNGFSNAVSRAREFRSQAVSAGVDLVLGFVQGVQNRARALVDAVGGAVRGAINKAKALLGIHSPSRVFRDMGVDTTDGYAIGLERNDKAPIRAMENLMGGVVGAYDTSAMNLSGRLGGVNGSVQSRVEHSLKDSSSSKQPTPIILNLGSKAYRGFIEDISNAQGREVQLHEHYAF